MPPSEGGGKLVVEGRGGAIRHIGNIHKYARPEDVPEHTMFIITTDGMENASRRYDSDQVKRMIEEKKAQGWEFLFLAANIDAVKTAARVGISQDRAVNYHADSQGTDVVYETVAETVCQMRAGAPRPWQLSGVRKFRRISSGARSKLEKIRIHHV